MTDPKLTSVLEARADARVRPALPRPGHHAGARRGDQRRRRDAVRRDRDTGAGHPDDHRRRQDRRLNLVDRRRPNGPAPSPARSRCPGAGTTIALFLLPALVLYGVFVLFPIVQAAHFSLFDWNGLTPAHRLRRARQLRSGRSPTRCSIKAATHNAIIVVLSLAIQIPFALGSRCMLNRRFRGRAIFRAALLRAVRHLRGHHRHRLAAAAPPGRPGRRGPDVRRPRLLCPALAGRPRHRPADDVRHHLVEVLRLPHDPHAGRPAGHPARAGGGRGHRRRQPPPDASATSRCRCSARRSGCRSSCRSSARSSCSTSSG